MFNQYTRDFMEDNPNENLKIFKSNKIKQSYMKVKPLLLIVLFLVSSCNNTNSDNKMSTKETETVNKTLRHVVLFKFKDAATTNDINTVELAFKGLQKQITEIKDFEWGINNSPEQLEKGFTHCFFLTFNSTKDRDTYLTHPSHLEFGNTLKPFLDDVLVVDYWIK